MSGPMGLVYATPGDTTDTWGTVINTLLGLVENHDHSSGKGSQVPSSGLGINADVSWATHAITAMSALAFSEVTAASVVGYSDALFASSADHNLYFRNSVGTNVQITAGNTLNVAIVGGIGGDYSSVSALLSYDDATRRYLLQQEGSPRPWAGLATGDIDLYQKAASIANKVTLKSPAALAASYSTTWLAALPAAQSLMFIDNAGQMTASNSMPGNVVLGHGTWTLMIPASAAQVAGNVNYLDPSGTYLNPGTGTLKVAYPIPLKVGDVITGYRLHAFKGSTNAKTIACRIHHSNMNSSLTLDVTDGAGASNSANTPNSDVFATLAESGLSLTLATGTIGNYSLILTPSGDVLDFYGQLEIDFTH